MHWQDQEVQAPGLLALPMAGAIGTSEESRALASIDVVEVPYYNRCDNDMLGAI
jgi:hypothetical protein